MFSEKGPPMALMNRDPGKFVISLHKGSGELTPRWSLSVWDLEEELAKVKQIYHYKMLKETRAL